MNSFRKIFYMVSFLPWFYHYLLAWLGAAVYSFPSKKTFVIGVTGTKGKSTVVELLNAVLKAAGKKTAILGSVAVEIDGRREDNETGNTMPGRFFIQRFLRLAVDANCQYAIIEVTSEGVKLNRHRFIDWQAAVFLNLHPEHIESHGSFEKYRSAKVDFFKYVASLAGGQKRLFFINKDDENAEYFVKAASPSSLRGRSPKQLPSVIAREQSDRSNLILFSKSNLTSRMFGWFNEYNVGAAAVVARKLGVSDDVIKKAVADFAGVPGRMEVVQEKPFKVVVDYAHTPDSLKAVYETLRNSKLNDNRLICVLGSAGGGRDRWKRPEMGRIAAEYCDEIILTNEDSYDEDPEKIIEEIAKGSRQLLFVIASEAKQSPSSLRTAASAPLAAGKQPPSSLRGRSPKQSHSNSKLKTQNSKLWKILDRREAIKKALELACVGDVVVITGKGSERWIHIADGKKIPWSDKQTVIDLLK